MMMPIEPASHAPLTRYHLVTKPATGGAPIMLREARPKAPKVRGMARPKPLISEMSGLGRAMPLTFGAFGLASLSMIGAPPVAGFVTKWYLVNGAWDAGSIGIIIVLLASTLLNAAYFAP